MNMHRENEVLRKLQFVVYKRQRVQNFVKQVSDHGG